MTESQKTLMYVVAAALMAVAGGVLAPRGPQAPKDSLEALIGAEFYKGFKNPSEATSIEVISYDAATATPTPFGVEFKDGLWRIPTRYNYPADAKDRLAKVAASIIGLKREALAGRTETEQVEFQVLDPKSDKTESLKGIGNRLTLKKGETVLADYIIGKQVPSRSGYYYVRRPDEKPTFIAKLELNLSTKFTDWIESDVLNLDGNKLTHIDIRKHSIEIERGEGRIGDRERNLLTRKIPADPWKLEDLDDAAEEINQDEVRKLVSALDDLKIVGVRPKADSLRKGLQASDGITLDKETQVDMARRGYFFQPNPRGGLEMIAMEGDMTAGTDQGVEYDMHFGDAFEGSEEDIEKGILETPAEQASSEDGEKKPDGDKKPDEKSGSKKKSRFLFVTAHVNPELLGPEPEEPIKPEPPSKEPAEETPKETPKEKSSEDKSDEKESDKEPSDAAASDDSKSDTEKSEGDKPDEPPQPPKVDPEKAHQEALKKYEADKQRFASDLKARADKLKDAEEKVKVLNARFADWYYVISAESFENLRQGRKTLVKPKAGTETKPDGEQPPGEGDSESEDGAAPKESATESKETSESTKKPE